MGNSFVCWFGELCFLLTPSFIDILMIRDAKTHEHDDDVDDDGDGDDGDHCLRCSCFLVQPHTCARNGT